MKSTKPHGNLGRKHTKEELLKMSWSHTGDKNVMWGKHHSEEAKKKISQNRVYKSGPEHPKYGKSLSEETKKKISASNTGRKKSPEVLERISETFKKKWSEPEFREKVLNGRKETWATEEYRECQSNSHKGAKNYWYGRHHSEESLKKLSENRKGKYVGESNHFWKGGVSFEPYCVKFNKEFKERCRAFFGDKCVICGKTTMENGRLLDVHHVDFDKSACCNGDRNPRFVALCISHHSTVTNNRNGWEYIFNRIIDEVYSGKCYYSKEEFRGWEENS